MAQHPDVVSWETAPGIRPFGRPTGDTARTGAVAARGRISRQSQFFTNSLPYITSGESHPKPREKARNHTPSTPGHLGRKMGPGVRADRTPPIPLISSNFRPANRVSGEGSPDIVPPTPTGDASPAISRKIMSVCLVASQKEAYPCYSTAAGISHLGVWPATSGCATSWPPRSAAHGSPPARSPAAASTPAPRTRPRAAAPSRPTSAPAFFRSRCRANITNKCASPTSVIWWCQPTYDRVSYRVIPR